MTFLVVGVEACGNDSFSSELLAAWLFKPKLRALRSPIGSALSLLMTVHGVGLWLIWPLMGWCYMFAASHELTLSPSPPNFRKFSYWAWLGKTVIVWPDCSELQPTSISFNRLLLSSWQLLFWLFRTVTDSFPWDSEGARPSSIVSSRADFWACSSSEESSTISLNLMTFLFVSLLSFCSSGCYIFLKTCKSYYKEKYIYALSLSS